MRLRSARRKASRCRRLVPPSSQRPASRLRPSATRHGPRRRSPGPPLTGDNRNILEKLFGWAHAICAGSGGVRHANAHRCDSADRRRPQQEGNRRRGSAEGHCSASRRHSAIRLPAPISGYDRYTAVYDISARVVYLPDGTRLEAHSGLGDALDNPRYVAERAVGPTPPHVYELTLREGSFHGVQALRLNPVGEGGIYGRAGLLAHPFMLGPNGDSNGCVSFRDYDAFLRAYQNGQVKKLAVVAKL